MNVENILIIGGTGKTGRRVAEQLKKKGIEPRIGSRNALPSFDWNNKETWVESLAGIEKMYVTYHPDLAVPGAKEAIESLTYLAKELGADNIELHTGKYCKFFREKNNLIIKKEFNKIKNSAKLGINLNLGVHAGHGLNYQTSKKISEINEISELNIGHFFISESIFFGIANVLKKFNKILKR